MASLSSMGQVVDDWPHITDCITKILTTPLGTRVMRRDFGSELPSLVDAPMNSHNLMKIHAATVKALEPRLVRGFWYGEPRVRVVGVEIKGKPATGAIEVEVMVVTNHDKKSSPRAVIVKV